ncbi:hypothetical protein ACC736_32855 [Rhizobium ruizarguesonis]
MDPVTAIVGALVAGATAAASGVAGDAVKDAYQGLRTVLIDSYKFVSASLLEKKPTDRAFQSAVESELRENPAIVNDEQVLNHVQAVQEALKSVPPEQLAAWGVDVKEIIAAKDVIADQITGTAGGLRSERIQAGGDVRLTNISGGTSSGNK